MNLFSFLTSKKDLEKFRAENMILAEKLKKAEQDLADLKAIQAAEVIKPQIGVLSKPALKITDQQAFFSGTVHDLRGPLTIIRLASSILASQYETIPKEKILEHLKQIDEGSLELSQMINNFLNISRIEQGRLEIEKKPFDITAVSEEVAKELTALAKAKNLFMHHESTGAHMVIGDKEKAKEVLINLIGNAIKYTFQGGVTINHLEEEGWVVTNISDTGVGIPEQSKGLLFQVFMQVGSARMQSVGKSSGLGLFISKKIAQAMDGDVVLASSEPGKGSTFSLRLPVG